MRPPSLSCTWCSGTSWSSVAAYSFTGTLTRPKLREPFQMERMLSFSSADVDDVHPGYYREVMAKSEGTDSYVNVGGHRLRLTNLDKVLYPETGTTKGEVIDYYSRVADALI